MSPIPTPEKKRVLLVWSPELQAYEMDIDNTSLEVFATCARAAQYRLINGRETSDERAALAYGSAKHHYLEARLKGASPQEAERLMVCYMAVHMPSSDDEWRNISHALDSVRLYEKHWEHHPFDPLRDSTDTLIVERPFRIPLLRTVLAGFQPRGDEEWIENDGSIESLAPSPVVIVYWTGKIDLVTREAAENWVVDHKTSSMGGPTFFDDFYISSQTLGYTWAARHEFPEHPIRGLLLNVLIGRKPTKSGVAHEFHRQRYPYSDEHISEWHRNVQFLCTDFLAHLCRGYFPMQTKWCMGKYGACQYHKTCTALPSQRHLMLNSTFYKDVTWSPLNLPSLPSAQPMNTLSEYVPPSSVPESTTAQSDPIPF